MIVGAYSLHLYCAAWCSMQEERGHKIQVSAGGACRGEFSGPTERLARRDARAAGWIFAKGEAWCSKACLAKGPAPGSMTSDGREVQS